MNAKTIVTLGLKVIALTIILLVCYVVATAISGVSAPSPATTLPSNGAGVHMKLAVAEPAPTDASAVLLPLLVSCLLEAAVFTYLILRSRWFGWKLVGAIFVAFYGSNTVVTQFESVVYLQRQLPSGMVPRLFVMGAIVAGLFSPLAVLILGKMRRKGAPQTPNQRPGMVWREWVWKLATIAVAYLILYYTFGYFVAWKNSAVQAYYGGTDPGSFFAQLAAIWAATPWMFPYQALRGILWTAFTLPVIRMHKGQRWEVSLAAALLFAVWSSQLLLPNPFMPEAVARVHLVETLSSNLLFGGLVGWLLSGTKRR